MDTHLLDYVSFLIFHGTHLLLLNFLDMSRIILVISSILSDLNRIYNHHHLDQYDPIFCKNLTKSKTILMGILDFVFYNNLAYIKHRH